MNKYNPELVKDPGQAAADYVDDLILEKMIEIAKTNNMGDKYQALGSNLFGFEMFEEILKVVGERKTVMDDQNFRAGVASCESAIARLREDYYNSLKFLNDEQT